LTVSGGSLSGRPCEAFSPHGYYGIEDKVVLPSADWIKAHRAGADTATGGYLPKFPDRLPRLLGTQMTDAR